MVTICPQQDLVKWHRLQIRCMGRQLITAPTSPAALSPGWPSCLPAFSISLHPHVPQAPLLCLDKPTRPGHKTCHSNKHTLWASWEWDLLVLSLRPLLGQRRSCFIRRTARQSQHQQEELVILQERAGIAVHCTVLHCPFKSCPASHAPKSLLSKYCHIADRRASRFRILSLERAACSLQPQNRLNA